MVNQSLERINENAQSENNGLIAEIRLILQEPHTIGIADRLLPQVNKIHVYADSVRLMLGGIKKELIAQSDSLKVDFVPVNELVGKEFWKKFFVDGDDHAE